MKRLLLIVFCYLCCFTSLRAQTSLWVGETYTCDVSSAILGSVYNMNWSSSGGYFKITGSGFYRTITITQYFSGSASITCSWDYSLYSGGSLTHNSKTWTFTCKDNPATINPSSLSLKVGQTSQVSCQLSYSNSYTSNAAIYFQSTQPNIASVDTYSGQVTAISPGTAYINAYSKVSGNSPYCIVTVTDAGGENGNNDNDNVFTTTINNINYELKTIDSTASVTGLSTSMTSVNIPPYVTYNGKQYIVRTIAARAFFYKNNLQSISLPNTITQIGYQAFSNCESLTTITIPNSVLEIDYWAFYGCSGLLSVSIPDKVHYMGFGVFRECTNLTSVTIGNGLYSIPTAAFVNCQSLTTITIGTNVTSFETTPFSGCKKLSTIIWNAKNYTDASKSSVSPFYELRQQIKSFTVGDSVQHVPSYLCYGMNNLYSISIGTNVTSFGSDVFSLCSNLSTISWNAKECRSFTSYSQSPFYNLRKQISSVTFGQKVQSIPAYLCYEMGKLKSLTILDSVTSIGSSAFYRCSGLTSIIVSQNNTIYDSRNNCNAIIETATNKLIAGCNTSVIPENVTSIGNSAFNSCSDLTSINIPDSVTSIGYGAFCGCSSLTSLTIPPSVKYIGSYAFESCTSLSFVSIPNTKLLIEGNAFEGCTSLPVIDNIRYADSFLVEAIDKTLSNYNIKDGTRWIASDAFMNCSALTYINLPNTVSYIGSQAFKNCSALTRVDMTDSVSYIGQNAFASCTMLSRITLPEGISDILGRTFEICANLDSIIIPHSVKRIGAYAFNGCSKLSKVIIPDSVESIENYAFSSCTSLNSVTCNAIVPPLAGDRIFFNCPHLALYVPCGQLEVYKSAEGWSLYDSIMQYSPLSYKIYGQVNIPGSGNVIVPPNTCEDTVIVATPNYGYHFIQWSDGSKVNPRPIELFQDTMFVAEFAPDITGVCGHENQLIWAYDSISKTLSISGHNALDENYKYGVQAPSQMEHLIITEGVTSIGNLAFSDICSATETLAIPGSVISIGDSAFAGMKNRKFDTLVLPNSIISIGAHAFDGASYLKTIYFGSELEDIGDYAFNGCMRVQKMTCLAGITPNVGVDGLISISSLAELHIPNDYLFEYQIDDNWKRFVLKAINTTGTTITTDGVLVEADDNTATLTWPISNDAATYIIQITKDGVVLCTLIFNANGQLTDIAFAPSRNGSRKAPAATMTSNGMQFIVTGLNSGTNYVFTLIVKDAQDEVIASYSGKFITTGAQMPTAIEEVYQEQIPTTYKLLRNGQIFILHGDKTYTLQGQEVK